MRSAKKILEYWNIAEQSLTEREKHWNLINFEEGNKQGTGKICFPNL